MVFGYGALRPSRPGTLGVHRKRRRSGRFGDSESELESDVSEEYSSTETESHDTGSEDSDSLPSQTDDAMDVDSGAGMKAHAPQSLGPASGSPAPDVPRSPSYPAASVVPPLRSDSAPEAPPGPAPVDSAVAEVPVRQSTVRPMTKRMRHQITASGGMASSATLNALTIADIDSRVDMQMAGVEVNPSCGMKPAQRLAAKSSYKGLATGLVSPQRNGRKRHRHRRSKSTIEKELVSPIKRNNSINDKIIMEELKLFNCHKSIWSQRSKNEDGKGLVIPSFELKLQKGDGAGRSCTVCTTGVQGHHLERSRQCKLHCVSRAMNVQYVKSVRELVAESFACKTTAVITLLREWHNITAADTQAVIDARRGCRPGDLDSAKKLIRQKLYGSTKFKLFVPRDPTACSDIEGWTAAHADPVCILGFAMITGIQPYRVRLAKECIYNGEIAFVSRVNQRALRIESKLAVQPQSKTSRGDLIRSWLQSTLRNIVQTHANGQKRVQDAQYTTATALARGAIAAFWNHHQDLARKRKVERMRKMNELKLLSESEQNLEDGHQVVDDVTARVAMPVRDREHQPTQLKGRAVSQGQLVLGQAERVSNFGTGARSTSSTGTFTIPAGPTVPRIQATVTGSATVIAPSVRRPGESDDIDESGPGDNDSRLLYLAPSASGAMTSDRHSVSAVNRLAGLIQKKPTRSKTADAITKSMDEAQRSGIEPNKVMDLVGAEYKSHTAVDYKRPTGDSSAQAERNRGERGDDDQNQDEIDAVLEYGLNLRRFSLALPSALAQIDGSVHKADVVRTAMTEAENDMKKKAGISQIEKKRSEMNGEGPARQILADIQKRSKMNPFVQMALKIDGIIRSAKARNDNSSPSTCLGLAAATVVERMTSGPIKEIEKRLPRELRQVHMKTVLKIIRDEFGELDFPQACDLGTCVDCDFFTRALGNRDRDLPNSSARLGSVEQEAYSDLRAREMLHRSEHIAERGAFQDRQTMVLSNPRRYILIIYDYSMSIFLPKYVRGTKTEMEHQQLEIKIAAIIVYANGRRYNYIFIHDATLPKGSNTMLTALYSVIRYHKSFGDAQHAETLYLQCDGGVENVSFTPFGFHDFLVRHGWFERVELNRLPVGHSHQLVDAFFSAISVAYRKGSMTSVSGIIKRLNETWDGGSGVTPEDKVWMHIMRPQFVWLNHVMDFGSLFRPRMNVIVNMRARVLGWLFERADKDADASGFHDVNVWYMVSPALDTHNGHGWRGCNGIEKTSTGQVARPLKLFDQADLNRADAQDPRKMAPGNMKLSKDFLCKTRARTLEV